jgi:hypothetical protein
LSIIAQICPDIFLRPIVIEQAGVGFHQVVEMMQHDVGRSSAAGISV